ncbi:MAG: hypothetical protein Q7S69_07455 [Nitrosomonadaceae bacterium]|nr:hypothetical protein [Nitrosomonadaceae bacterium]
MATLESRLATLEQHKRASRPELVLIYTDEQEGEPTAEQAAQIVLAARQGRGVRVIRFTRAEDKFPGLTGKKPER